MATKQAKGGRYAALNDFLDTLKRGEGPRFFLFLNDLAKLTREETTLEKAGKLWKNRRLPLGWGKRGE